MHKQQFKISENYIEVSKLINLRKYFYSKGETQEKD